MRGRLAMAACLGLLLAPRVTAAAADSTAVRTSRPLSFTPHPLERCRMFMITETSFSRVAIDADDAWDEYILTNSLGVMVNLDPSWAIGGAAEAQWARGHVKPAVSLRLRRWFANEKSLEAAAGWVLGGERIDFGGTRIELQGPIASLRYSPTPYFFVQAGACRFREQSGAYVPPTYDFVMSRRDYSKAFAGIGLSDGAGATLWLVEAVAFGVLIAMFANME